MLLPGVVAAALAQGFDPIVVTITHNDMADLGGFELFSNDGTISVVGGNGIYTYLWSSNILGPGVEDAWVNFDSQTGSGNTSALPDPTIQNTLRWFDFNPPGVTVTLTVTDTAAGMGADTVEIQTFSD